MRLRRTARFTTAAAVLAAGLATATTAAAGTAPSPGDVTPAGLSDCPAAAMCLWKNAQFDTASGFWHWRYANYPHDTWIDLGTADKKASSLYNNRGNPTMIMNDQGSLLCVAAQQQAGDLANGYRWREGESVNDTISGIDLLSPGVVCNALYLHN